MRYFIQHIDGDPPAIPVALRYVKHDTIRDTIGGGATAEWTENPDERAEWEIRTDATTWRGKLGKGIVLHTEPEPAKIEEEISLREKREPLPEIPKELIEERRRRDWLTTWQDKHDEP